MYILSQLRGNVNSWRPLSRFQSVLVSFPARERPLHVVGSAFADIPYAVAIHDDLVDQHKMEPSPPLFPGLLHYCILCHAERSEASLQ